jgi:hypothetical protein
MIISGSCRGVYVRPTAGGEDAGGPREWPYRAGFRRAAEAMRRHHGREFKDSLIFLIPEWHTLPRE